MGSKRIAQRVEKETRLRGGRHNGTIALIGAGQMASALTFHCMKMDMRCDW